MYAFRFRSLYFGSLSQGRLFGRRRTNEDRLATVLRSRGFSEYGTAVTPQPHSEPHPPRFDTTPLQVTEFDQTLTALQDKAVQVGLLVMPEVQDTASEADDAYLAYLQNVAEGFPNAHLVSQGIPRWPGRMFVDGVHLTGAGGRLLTERLADCIAAKRIQPHCDLSWRDVALPLAMTLRSLARSCHAVTLLSGRS